MIRYISVPKDKAAQELLNKGEATDDQLLELELDPAQFISLWETGIFEAINSIAGSDIDMFESETIENKAALTRVLGSGIFEETARLENPLVISLKQLFIASIERDTDISFFF